MKNFIEDLKFILMKLIPQVLFSIFIGFLIIEIVQNIFKVDVLSLSKERPYVYFVGIIIVVYVLNLLKYIYILKVSCGRARVSLEVIRDRSQSLYKEMLEAELDVLKMKISILKSFSPIPVIVLFLGLFIEPSKYNPTVVNYFTLTVAACIFFYFVSLYKSFLLYRMSRSELVSYRQKEQVKS